MRSRMAFGFCIRRSRYTRPRLRAKRDSGAEAVAGKGKPTTSVGRGGEHPRLGCFRPTYRGAVEVHRTIFSAVSALQSPKQVRRISARDRVELRAFTGCLRMPLSARRMRDTT